MHMACTRCIVGTSNYIIESTTWRKQKTSIMNHRHIILYNCISFCVKLDSLRLCISTSKSEKPGPSNDRHFPHCMKHWIPPQYTECTAIVFPLNKGVSQDHQQSRFSRMLLHKSLGLFLWVLMSVRDLLSRDHPQHLLCQTLQYLCL